MHHLIQIRFNFVDLILHQNLHNNFIIYYKTHCIQMAIYNINAFFMKVSEGFQFAKNMRPHQGS
jgi:hypothetical protein